MMKHLLVIPVGCALLFGNHQSLAFSPPTPAVNTCKSTALCALYHKRRDFLLSTSAALLTTTTTLSCPSRSNAEPLQDSLDIDSFLRTGVDAGGNMGVSSQAGKSRPQTGVVFRDGTEVFQDGNGQVSAEILTGTTQDPNVVLVSFRSPWKLQTGSVFDVECRDAKSGDGAFLAVTQPIAPGKTLESLPSSFFLERLFDPTGRFSFYGPPTDIKVKSSVMKNNNDSRLLEVAFSNLSQSTNAEIPRKAFVMATIPEGSDKAIMLVASANASRWNKDTRSVVQETMDSFRAVPAPKTGLKVRPKRRGQEPIL